MPRNTRIALTGAFYQVINRENKRTRIFKHRPDLEKYLTILAYYKTRYSFYLYGYVLMGNHVHLLIETEDVHLSKILQGINQSYTMYFNRKYGSWNYTYCL